MVVASKIAGVIWQATNLFQIKSYNLYCLLSRYGLILSGSLSGRVGRIASWASWAPLALAL